MGQPESTLHYLMGSKIRARLIEKLVTHDYDAEPLWLRELARHTRSGFSGLYRERKALEHVGFMRAYRHTSTICFSVNEEHPLYVPLSDLVEASLWIDEARGGPPRFEKLPPIDVR